MEEINFQQSVVAVVSRDPFFLFTTKSLLGRDRLIRIHSVALSLDDLKLNLNKDSRRVQLIVCDLDSLSISSSFYDELKAFILERGDAQVLCLVEGMLNTILPLIAEIPIRALLSKHDLGYCLHLAIRAVMASERVLVTASVKEFLDAKSPLYINSRIVGQERPYPGLTKRVAEVILWRTLIGLDNSDIQDEMILEQDTIREYVSKGYKALGADNELDAFEALSDWWWISRFMEITIP